MNPRGVTIVVHTDGDIDSKQYRLPVWAFTLGKWGALAVGLLLVLFLAFAGPLTRAASRVPRLEREVARLREENRRVQRLAAALNRAEANYQSLRQLLGGRAPSDTAEAPADATAMMRAPVIQAAPAGARSYEQGASAPSHWPLDVAGFVTRGRVGEDTTGEEGESHAGIDIAVPIGTPVRAAGGGTVEAAGTDRNYGLFVLLRHPNGYESMYGHASRILVREGEAVSAGEVIALSGNSGRSTAPHLHFEVRREGLSLDPLAFVKEGT